ncbi:MAG: hypothetical protein O9290_19145 [Microcystis sp. LE19-41.2A]|uniref:hypothetical protein n=1 Tax=Microcystis sp. LE19-41.2A TaxID=3016427 RepID=UPI0022C2FE69|nr:hypothetical protein [Microcystis sp. LE19-41.2A]MCZ8048694.1 hypothetical protein [Microcystis sp. LE19-41.2A]
MATSKLVKPHTPHPTPHTLPPPKNFLPQTLVSPSLVRLSLFPLFFRACRRVIIIIAKIKG